MTRSKFEHFASSKITQHQSPVDADALWKAVAPEAPKKKRRVVFWYFLTGLLVTGLVSAIMWSKSNTLATDGDSQAVVQTETGQQHAETPIENTVSNNLSTNKVLPSSHPKNNIQKDEIAISTSQSEIESSPGNEITASQGQRIGSTSTASESRPNEIENNHATTPSVVENNTITSVQNENQQPDGDVIQPDVRINKIGHADVVIEKHETQQTSDISTLLLDVEPSIPDSNRASSKSKATSKHKVVYSIGAYGGISGTSSTLTAKQSSSTSYLNARNQTEEQLEGIQFGLEIGAEIVKGLAIKSGVEVSRIARVFSFTEEVMVVDSVYGLKEIYVNNQTQDTINIYGQTPVITTTAYNKRIYNNISQIDIPVKVGYTFQSGKWRLGMDAGAIINLNTSYTGEILSPDGSFYDLKSDPENWFKTNAGIAFSAGLRAGRMLGSSFEMYLAPVYRSPSVFSTDANPIEQKHARLGVNLGLRYLLGH